MITVPQLTPAHYRGPRTAFYRGYVWSLSQLESSVTQKGKSCAEALSFMHWASCRGRVLCHMLEPCRVPIAQHCDPMESHSLAGSQAATVSSPA